MQGRRLVALQPDAEASYQQVVDAIDRLKSPRHLECEISVVIAAGA